MRLMREVRFFDHGPESDRREINNWAGAADGKLDLPFWTVRAVVEGPVDPGTGYLCDIRRIDEWVHSDLAPKLHAAVTPRGDGLPSRIAQAMTATLAAAASNDPSPARVASLQVRISPFTSLTAKRRAPNLVHLTQSYEFSASHRLYCEGLSDEQNRELFGKCSNPHGHGHNYVLEVTVEGGHGADFVDVASLDRTVRLRVIEPFDHKNLNVECPEFNALNPTVENIARVIFERLIAPLRPRRLCSVRVWETPKTYAEYSGDGEDGSEDCVDR